MCFNATASFVGAGIVLTAGVGSLALVRDKRQIPFATLPLIFGLHQFMEGVTWLKLDNQARHGEVQCLTGYDVHLWVLIAWALFPLIVPWSVWFMERDPRRRKLLLIPSWVGTILFVYMMSQVLQPAIQVSVNGGNLDYVLPGFSPGILAYPYVFATCIAPAMSSYRYVVMVGVGNFIAMTIAAWMNVNDYASIWCTFAAFLSIIIFLHFWHERRVEGRTPTGSPPRDPVGAT